MNKKNRDVLITGFALFAVFFGAGNLVFPPAIGIAAGEGWIAAIAGLTITGIILPLLAVLAVGKVGGEFSDLARPAAPWFYNVFWYFSTFLASCITIPRIGGTAYEVGYGSVFDSGSKVATYVFLIVFFALVYYFTCDKNAIVDKVGKILTPVLIVILAVVIISGIVNPIGTPVGHPENTFSTAFIEAYNIGDLVTGLLCAGIFIISIKAKGYSSQREVYSMTAKSVVIAFIGLFVVYGGLCYIGATAGSVLPADMEQTALLVAAVQMLLGKGGMIAFAVCTVLACLTTAIGITASVADFVANRTKGKLSFNKVALIICILDVFLASGGVAFLINMAGPIFMLLYPVAIVMVLLTFVRKYVPNHGAVKGAVLMAGIIGIYDSVGVLNALGILNIHISFLDKIYGIIPLSEYGFAWIVPSVLGFIVGAAVVAAFGKNKDFLKKLDKELEDKNPECEM